MRSPLLVVVSVFLLGIASARAEDVDAGLPEVLRAVDLRGLLAARSARIAAARAGVDFARADRIEANLRSNPTVGYEFGALAAGANVNGAIQHEIRLEQRLRRPALRRARTTAAERAIDAAAAEVATLEHDLVHAAARAYAELWLASRRLEVMDDSLERLRTLVAVAEQRRQGGVASGLDVARLALEAQELELERSNLERARLEALEALDLVLAAPGYAPRLEGPLPGESTTMEPERAEHRALEMRPELVAARMEREAAETVLRAEQLRARPEASLVAGALLTQTPASGALVAGLAVPIPVFDRNQAGVARARARLDAATRTVEALESETRTELRALLDRIATLSRAVETSRRGLALSTEVLPTRVEQAMRAGVVDAYQLVDALRAARASRMRLSELEAALASARLDLGRRLGL